MLTATIPFLDARATYEELREEVDGAYRRVMDAGSFILGQEVAGFEEEFADLTGTTECVGVASGLDAITVALRALGIGPGDEVIVPAHTFIATWLGVSATGARPVPVDADPLTRNIDPRLVEAAVTERTRALLPVHVYGDPADVRALAPIAAEHALAVVEDAAQAHGARLRGRQAGSLGHVAAFSFYPGKNLGAYGDGGAIVTSDADLADRMRLLRNYGSAQKYVHLEAGVNSRLDELQAAFLRVRLTRLEEWNARRARIAELYLRELGDCGDLVLPAPAAEALPSWHLFVVETAARDELRGHLNARGIGTGIHYPVPVHRSGAYAASFGSADLPVAERLADHVLSLPIGPHLSLGRAEAVVGAVRSYFD